MLRWVVLHAILYSSRSFHSGNTPGNLPSRRPGSNSETRGRFCDGLGSNIMLITLHGQITAMAYVDSLGSQVHPMIQTFLKKRCSFPRWQCPNSHSWNCLFSHGLKSMKVNFNIFPGQHNHQIWTSLNHSDQFWIPTSSIPKATWICSSRSVV
jgi:hypothetical protein